MLMILNRVRVRGRGVGLDVRLFKNGGRLFFIR